MVAIRRTKDTSRPRHCEQITRTRQRLFWKKHGHDFRVWEEYDCVSADYYTSSLRGTKQSHRKTDLG